MNRLTEYIKNSKAARDSLKEARIQINYGHATNLAILNLIDAVDSLMRATNCAVSIRENKKPKGGKS